LLVSKKRDFEFVTYKPSMTALASER